MTLKNRMALATLSVLHKQNAMQKPSPKSSKVTSASSLNSLEFRPATLMYVPSMQTEVGEFRLISSVLVSFWWSEKNTKQNSGSSAVYIEYYEKWTCPANDRLVNRTTVILSVRASLALLVRTQVWMRCDNCRSRWSRCSWVLISTFFSYKVHLEPAKLTS